jgi:uncharacterized HAD superfamily protein/adenine/guanine phosphoribosyltransferase-like PRPP-binding protein
MNVNQLPSDIGLVVGVPRGGGLAGAMVALSLNVPYLDLDAFLSGQEPKHGLTRSPRSIQGGLHVLIVDDRIESGDTLRKVRQRVEAGSRCGKVSYCAIYASSAGSAEVDFFFDLVEGPVLFQWNIARCGVLADCCIDIDGVLCKDPTRDQNDGDGPAYLKFLKEASPITFPSDQIGYLVTSRLERYRAETEDWLASHGFRFKALHMLDLPDATTRGRLKAQAGFKAGVFMSYPASPLFVESCRHQAYEIATTSGRPVLCFDEHRIYTNDSPPPPSAPARKSRPQRLISLASKVVSEISYGRIRQWNVRPMQYRSYGDLARAVSLNLHKIPRDVDLVVGIPRSGLLAGSLIALSKNIPIIDLDGFLKQRTLDRGDSGDQLTPAFSPSNAKHVLVIDDSIYRGDSMALAREALRDPVSGQQLTYCAVYAHPRSHHLIDLHFESLESPGCQEWNFLHRDKAAAFCLEMDGVLCEAPSESCVASLEDYRNFCSSARPLFHPTYRVGWIVTARPESLRKETEAWLEEQGIQYEGLRMLPPPAASRGNAFRDLVTFKAGVYARTRRSLLFVEGDPSAARAIAKLSGKSVLSFGDQTVFNPDISRSYLNDAAARIRRKLERRLRRTGRPLVAVSQ